METISVIYMKCQFCTARTRCEGCSRELEESLSGKRGIRSVQVNIPDKKIMLDHTLDEDDLEDTLDALGLLMG